MRSLMLLALASVATAEVRWIAEFERAKEIALAEDKLIFLDFYAEW